MKYNETDRPRLCMYCENASPLRSETEMLCRYRGVVSALHVCRKFMYDPLKRRPRIMPDLLIWNEISDTGEDTKK